MRHFVGAGLAAAILLAAGAAVTASAQFAQTTRVAVPPAYATTFVLYDKVDKPDRKIVRFLYVSPEAAGLRDAGRPLPNGTVVVMEDHAAETDAAGNVVTAADGRLVPTARITAIAVMEKREGWGATIPEAIRNGDWDYGAFDGAGQRRAVATEPCFACHKPHGARDFTFSTLTRPIP
jgi:hypothetical protein